MNVSSGGGFGRGVGKKFVSKSVTQDLAQDHPSIPFSRNCLSLEFYTFSFRSMLHLFCLPVFWKISQGGWFSFDLHWISLNQCNAIRKMRFAI